MGWLPTMTTFEPVFPTLVRAFYTRMSYYVVGLITSVIRGVEIHLDLDSISRILDIALLDLEFISPRYACYTWIRLYSGYLKDLWSS